MNTLIILIAVLVIAFLIANQFSKSQRTPHVFPYQVSGPLLSNAERSFYGVLSQAIGNEGLIFSKVRIADIIQTQKGLSPSQRQRAFNMISSKHFDFVICDPKDTSVKFVIELDDSSHNKQNQKNRDHFVNNACEASGLPLLRVKASKGYVVETIRNQISQFLEPFEQKESIIQESLTSESPTQAKGQQNADFAPPPSPNFAEEKIEEAMDTKQCPKCGSNMVLRKAKSGKNAGQQFWGCSKFPKCRSAIAIDV